MYTKDNEMIKLDILWPNIPTVDIANEIPPQEGLFKISLTEFTKQWKGFPFRDIEAKRERLYDIFNKNYFDEDTVITDALSLRKLINTNFSECGLQDGSGFIYVYSFEDNILARHFKQGIFWWETSDYEAKLKIGRTERHPFFRIEQQFGSKTNIPEPPILLAMLWTDLVRPCERDIHRELRSIGKRLMDCDGEPARGGKEWFRDTPQEALSLVYRWIKEYRIDLSGLIPATNKTSSLLIMFSDEFKRRFRMKNPFENRYSLRNKRRKKTKINIENICLYRNSAKIKADGIWFSLPDQEVHAIKIKEKDNVVLRLKNGERAILSFQELENNDFEDMTDFLASKMCLVKFDHATRCKTYETFKF
jgi:hypothetical protein